MGGAYSSSAVEEIVRNAELRTELEPYTDESVTRVQCCHWTLKEENQFLASMLQWEKAPVLPIYKWFEPELRLPAPHTVSENKLPELLEQLISMLYTKHIVLDFTDHLSDLELYTVIVQKILPQNEKKIDTLEVYRHWDCSRVSPSGDETEDAKIWLMYYASDHQRELWAETYGEPLPEKRIPNHHRDLPKDETLHY